jgi:hypothetical protein
MLFRACQTREDDLMAYPWTGAQRALFASDGYDGYAT